jgi:hypothetical protein
LRDLLQRAKVRHQLQYVRDHDQRLRYVGERRLHLRARVWILDAEHSLVEQRGNAAHKLIRPRDDLRLVHRIDLAQRLQPGVVFLVHLNRLQKNSCHRLRVV